MDRIYESGAVETPPAAPESPSEGYPSAGNPATATPATKPGPYWYHMITESMRRVIVAAGLAPNHANLDRFKDAIVALSAAALTAATEAVAGVLRIATQAETNAGTADDRIVTPKKLKFGFLISLGTNGYIVFPGWMGGLIIQWVQGATSTAGEVSEVVTLPITFPNSNLFSSASSIITAVHQNADTFYQVLSKTTSRVTVFRQQSQANSIAAAPLVFAIGY